MKKFLKSIICNKKEPAACILVYKKAGQELVLFKYDYLA
ncbi:hypothetical protein STRMA_0762 [Streptococcus macacae NCTC 11558]|uniref:Uncharacterized protein n=1 Tax=Streptococcus macacae NCTC 11558 TaxID=764298 RepID=G5JVI6_9STRE|nr:hypothetical protein STRMA_0762 [Streptococcus macacae NCTC 11558]